MEILTDFKSNVLILILDSFFSELMPDKDQEIPKGLKSRPEKHNFSKILKIENIVSQWLTKFKLIRHVSKWWHFCWYYNNLRVTTVLKINLFISRMTKYVSKLIIIFYNFLKIRKNARNSRSYVLAARIRICLRQFSIQRKRLDSWSPWRKRLDSKLELLTLKISKLIFNFILSHL